MTRSLGAHAKLLRLRPHLLPTYSLNAVQFCSLKFRPILSLLVGLGSWFSLPLQAQERPANPCDSFNYIQTATGDCLDLTFLTKTQPDPLDRRFYQSLENVGVKITREPCAEDETTITYGLYFPDLNILQICTNNTKANEKQFLDTIVHEGWHVVQDCQAGFYGDSRNITPIIAGNSAALPLLQQLGVTSINAMVRQLSPTDLVDIQTLYSPEDLEIELEARFVQNYPETVLEALKLCPSRF